MNESGNKESTKISNTWLGVLLVAGCSASAAIPRPLPAPNLDRGIELYREGRFAEAAQVLEQAAADSPREARAWTYLGLARVKLNQPEDAMPALAKAVELDGKSAEAHFGKGLAHAHLDELDEAIAELETAVKLNASHAYAHYYLGLAFDKKGREDRALLHLERFLDLAPKAPEAPQVRELLSRLR